MSINIHKIEAEVNRRMRLTTSKLEIQQYAKILKAIKSNVVHYASTKVDLPDPTVNQGYLGYVSDEEAVYWATAAGWVLLASNQAKRLFTVGYGQYGELGNCTSNVSVSSPVQEHTSAVDWNFVSAGGYNTFSIKNNGTLWVWGRNQCGVLGNNRISNCCTLTQDLTSATDWCYVDVGIHTHSARIKTNNTMWVSGRNNCGQLGTNNTIDYSSPVQEITSATDWCFASAGCWYTTSIKTNGTLWSMGTNYCGALGTGDGLVVYSSPVQEISSATNWCLVSSGHIHTSAIKTDGTLWGWGFNLAGNLATNTNICYSSPIQEVTSATDWCLVSTGSTCNEEPVIAIKTDGTLWGWGCNRYGGLGNDDTINYSSPVQEVSSSTDWCFVEVERESANALKTNNSIWAWGIDSFGTSWRGCTTNFSSPVQEITSATDWAVLAKGQYHSVAIKVTNFT